MMKKFANTESWKRFVASAHAVSNISDELSKDLDSFIIELRNYNCEETDIAERIRTLELLNVSKRTLQRYRSSGDLPCQMNQHKVYL